MTIRETIAIEEVILVLTIAERYVRWKAYESGTLQSNKDHQKVLTMLHALERLKKDEQEAQQ